MYVLSWGGWTLPGSLSVFPDVELSYEMKANDELQHFSLPNRQRSHHASLHYLEMHLKLLTLFIVNYRL